MQKKNKLILHIMHSEIGGAGDIALNLNYTETNLLNTEYLLTGPKLFFGFQKKLHYLKKKIYFQKINKGLHFIKILSVIKKINEINPDVIFLHNYQVLPSLYFKLFKKKKIIYVDHMSLKLKKLKDYISLLISIFFFDKFVFVNKENYDNFKFIKSSKKVIIQNSVSDFFLNERKNLKKNSFLKIGIFGRINKLKNHNIIIDLLNENPKLKKNIKFYIAGSGESKINLLRNIRKYKLFNIIKYLGELDETKLRKWFNKIDLYLHPSFGEAMSLTILQAMSSKTPILASNVSGINNFIGKKKYLGLLFNNEISDLKEKLEYFIKLKKSEYKKFQLVQRNYFLKYHNLKKFKIEYKKVINDVIEF